ncbi:hypothetical protein F5Y13DRAFT_186493 [Hypoxylon sp. FL1857]|nr:hypothetical protein F5Y13DRAFT_186493 [Hypoxylon sp. FL1857]
MDSSQGSEGMKSNTSSPVIVPSVLSTNSAARPTSPMPDAPGTLHGFSMPDPGFDPSDNAFVKDYYKSKDERGALNPDDGIEEDVEEEVRRVVEDFENLVGRKPTDEERKKMEETTRRNKRGFWLESIKTQLVGKTEVPIEWFNQLAAENEQCIGFFAEKQAEISKERMEMFERTIELQKIINRLEEEKAAAVSAGDSECKAELKKVKAMNAALEAQVAKLVEDLANGGGSSFEADLREKNLRERIERLESELRATNQQRRELESKVDHLEEQLKQSRLRERALRNEVDGHEKTIKNLADQIDVLEGIRIQAERTIKELTDERDLLLRELKATQKRGESPDGMDVDDNTGPSEIPEIPEPPAEAPSGPKADFDTMKILRELKAARETGGEVSEEANELIDRWLLSVADAANIREYHIAVSEFRDAMIALRNRVVDLYRKMGAEEEGIDADKIIDLLEALLDEQPTDHPTKLAMLNMKLRLDVAFKEKRLQIAKADNQTLQALIELEKPDEQAEAELRMQYGMYDNEKVEEAVDARTQTFRIQRRGILDHIFSADRDLQRVAISCPDQETTEKINVVREKYLSLTSLPRPQPQPPR